MTYLYLKADIYPDLSKREEVEAAYAELMRASLAEPGCLLYDLVVDEENPQVWHMLEKWESRDAWNDHMTSGHVARIQELEPSLIVSPTVLNFYNPVLSSADFN
jgi:quinol monooxygenase YgiN